MKKLFKSFLVIALLMIFNLSQAQESINAAGGNAITNSGNVAYSIGQLTYSSYSSVSGSTEQGVQHPYRISTLSTNEFSSGIKLTAYPNPTLGDLTLEIGNHEHERLKFQIYNIQGKLLKRGEISSSKTQINMSVFPTAIYLMSIIDSRNKTIEKFKIIKE